MMMKAIAAVMRLDGYPALDWLAGLGKTVTPKTMKLSELVLALEWRAGSS